MAQVEHVPACLWVIHSLRLRRLNRYFVHERCEFIPGSAQIPLFPLFPLVLHSLTFVYRFVSFDVLFSAASKYQMVEREHDKDRLQVRRGAGRTERVCMHVRAYFNTGVFLVSGFIGY